MNQLPHYEDLNFGASTIKVQNEIDLQAKGGIFENNNTNTIGLHESVFTPATN